MSLPNAPPHPDPALDQTEDARPDHVAEKQDGAVKTQPATLAGKTAQSETPGNDDGDDEVGQRASASASASASARPQAAERIEGVIAKDMVEPEESAVASLKAVLETASDADPVDELTATTEDMALDATPPRAPTPTPTSRAAGKAAIRSPSPPPPPPKDDRYLATSNDPSRTTSPAPHDKANGGSAEDAAAAEYTAKYHGGEDAVDDSQSEIQSIMEQFDANPLLESPPVFPARQSSLASLDKPLPTPADDTASIASIHSPPPRTSSLYRVSTNPSFVEPASPSAHASQYKPAQPVPEPEPDLPFDFHRFLEQLRHRTADPVAKFLRSFLLEFGKKQWMVHEQVKIIGDFLDFITKKMAQCDVWRTVSDAEFDNAREGMEKLVMNRLYNQTFSPAIPPPEPASPRKGRRRQDPLGPGRRGQHQEDVERDEVLAQKVRIYQWVREDHLDIKPVGDKGRKFLNLAQQELLKMKTYRAPRDKIICILNCCKVIFGFLRTSKSDQSADAFVPLLIYTVLQANPDHLVSNVQYILRFRNQDKLGGEAGYYISSLMGAVQFIEGLDKTSLTVTDEEFEKHVEAAVSAIAERHAQEPEKSHTQPDPTHLHPSALGHRRMPSPHYHHLAEKATPSRPEVTTRNSFDAETSAPRPHSATQRNKPDAPDAPEEENLAVAGLLRTIQRPLSTIGRIFSDNDTHHHPSSSSSTPQQSNSPRPPPLQGPRKSTDHVSEKRSPGDAFPGTEDRHRQKISAQDAAARQASADAEEARRIQRQEHRVVVETLTGMFPQLDRDVIEDVVRGKDGRVGPAVDACLALANP
ncbi:hypothetical protein P153DRAFT_315949 [Dothidotthia symphoricarpi CBS 119687]|uniref:Uncharacterized protein n=1 Tax=Dothidotthia symphoricarpi CBS 119687 TaxID=1392245 RepID=A0A6A6AE82_9PLEO|nr:uncharacterized protein P153DRAFT_315949 [Dothidotthia symphoricarpi CBS 119687]KAF2129217.1 hypothetical protein P153DRAFT_315949 [Dothidotthia symphoricarpi CBS 119687]